MSARQWQLHGDVQKAADALDKAAAEVSRQHILTTPVLCIYADYFNSLKMWMLEEPLRHIKRVKL
jgi:hypothetical protein